MSFVGLTPKLSHKCGGVIVLCIVSFLLALVTTAASTAGVLSLTSQLKKLQETIEQKTKIEIGDIIQIRGYVHTYREEREIRVTTFCKHKLSLPKLVVTLGVCPMNSGLAKSQTAKKFK